MLCLPFVFFLSQSMVKRNARKVHFVSVYFFFSSRYSFTLLPLALFEYIYGSIYGVMCCVHCYTLVFGSDYVLAKYFYKFYRLLLLVFVSYKNSFSNCICTLFNNRHVIHTILMYSIEHWCYSCAPIKFISFTRLCDWDKETSKLKMHFFLTLETMDEMVENQANKSKLSHSTTKQHNTINIFTKKMQTNKK